MDTLKDYVSASGQHALAASILSLHDGGLEEEPCFFLRLSAVDLIRMPGRRYPDTVAEGDFYAELAPWGRPVIIRADEFAATFALAVTPDTRMEEQD